MFAIELTQDFKPIAERVTQGEKVLISCPEDENLVNLVVITEAEYNQLYMLKEKARGGLKKSIKALQKEAVVNGVADMTMEEINSEIAAYRREKSGL